MKRLAGVVVSACLGAQLATAGVADAFVPPPPSYQDQVTAAVVKGRAFLATQQDAAGCWSSQGVTTGVTALALLSILNSEPGGYAALPAADKAVADKGAKCLLAHVQPSGTITDNPPNPGEPLFTYETSTSIWALAGVPDPGAPAAIAGGRNWLIANQWNDGTSQRADLGGDPRNGGWWYSGGNTSSFVEHSNSSFAVAGLDATGGLPPATANLAQGFFTCLQRLTTCGTAFGPMDGGFIYSAAIQKGGTETSASGSGVLALILTGVGVPFMPNPDPRIVAGLAYLDQSLAIDPCNNLTHTANPLTANWVTSNTLIGYAEWANMKAHKLAGVPENLSDPNNYYFKLDNCITNVQQADGGFPESGREDRILATAFSLLTLEGVTGAEHTGLLKICKVAGPGVAVGTSFTFTVGNQTVTVPAGPPPGGNCVVVPGMFPVGANVGIHETIPAGSGVAVGGVAVVPAGQLVGNPDLPKGNVTVSIGSGVTEVTYTNKKTGYIEICKSSQGAPLSGNFTFFVNPGGLGPFVVPAGACTSAIEVPAGSVTVTETVTPGTALAGCNTFPAGQQGNCNLGAQSSTVSVAAGGVAMQTVVFMTNRRTTIDHPKAVADFDGDGDTDVSIFRPSTGQWFVQGGLTTTWGTDGDMAVPGDYNGDGTTDVAVFRPSNGAWYVQGQPGAVWGAAGDLPVPGDYNGDGRTDFAVFRPSNGAWYVQGQPGAIWGAAGDTPVPGDYNGDGRTDFAVFRPSNGAWYVLGQPGAVWGAAGAIPEPGDYNGDGRTDFAVFTPSTGLWSVMGGPTTPWGVAGDVPQPLPWAIARSFFP